MHLILYHHSAGTKYQCSNGFSSGRRSGQLFGQLSGQTSGSQKMQISGFDQTSGKSQRFGQLPDIWPIFCNFQEILAKFLPILAKYVCNLDESPAILPKLRYLPELRSDIRHFWTPTKDPDPAKCSAFCLARGPAPAGGQNLTFV